MNVFEFWNRVKQQTEGSKKVVYVKERDILFMRLRKNIGHEQDGAGEYFLRPVLVLKKFNNRLFWGTPLTTKNKSSKYCFSIGNFNGRLNWVVWSQLRIFDTKRAGKKLGVLPEIQFVAIKKIIAENL